MNPNLVAETSIEIDAPVEDVWEAIVSPAAIKEYMFGTNVESEWREGRPITWKGEWEGKTYEDKGEILEVRPLERISYSHFSPLSGLADEPANYHTVTMELSTEGGGTRVVLTQDNNATEDEKAHSEQNWNAMLSGLKKYVEG